MPPRPSSPSSPTQPPHDVLVRGGGAVGMALSLALGRIGLDVVLAGAAAPPRGPDIRAYALNAGSRELLTRLKVWDALPRAATTAVEAMRIVGDDLDSPGLLRFSAWQQQASALAWIVDAAALDAALAQAVRFAPHVHLEAADDGPLPSPRAALTVLAEGKASQGRQQLGVGWRRHDYGHTALAARLVSDEPHGGGARQWFAHGEVLALLPMDQPRAGHGYALVWSAPVGESTRRLGLDDEAFLAELQQRVGPGIGHLELQGARAAWPLQTAVAERFSGPGWVLVGDAAHAMHPLAGQGLNLGLADVAALAGVLARREAHRNVGDAALLRRYERERAAPTHAMLGMVDGLAQVFGRDDPGLRTLRNVGLSVVDRLPALKRWLAAQAIHS